MRINGFLRLFMLLFPMQAQAAESHHAAGEHPTVFHAFWLEMDSGKLHSENQQSWDFEGWVGTDYDKLWLRSEGEHHQGEFEEAEAWAVYSRNIAMFWDAQLGLRYDAEPKPTAYLVAGFTGLARYFFETDAHIFLSQHGALSARLRQENDLLITQRLIIQPYAEINLSSREVRESGIGRGVSYGEAGILTRYEITRKFAPYIDLHYERKFGSTFSLAERAADQKGGFVAAAGLRLMF